MQTKVIELEPGWLLVTFSGPKPPPDKRAFWLHRTLTDWLADHPGRTVTRTLAVQHNGELLGVHVWVAKKPIAVRIRKPVADEVHSEHLEAFLQHAHSIFFERTASVLAVVNRSGIAAVFDREKEQAYVVPVGELQPGAQALVKDWLAAPNTNYFVVELGGR